MCSSRVSQRFEKSWHRRSAAPLLWYSLFWASLFTFQRLWPPSILSLIPQTRKMASFSLFLQLACVTPWLCPTLRTEFGFSGGASGNAGDVGLIPGLGRSSGRGYGNPLQCSCLENPMDRGAWGLQSIRLQRVGHNWSDLARHGRTELQQHGNSSSIFPIFQVSAF